MAKVKATSSPEAQEKGISPKGEALWAFLTVPDKRWVAEGEYKVNLIMPRDKTSEAFIEKLEAIRDEYFDTLVAELSAAKVKKLSKREVYSDAVDAAGEETGNLEFKFSSKASGVSKKTGKDWEFIPRIYDSRPQLSKGNINIGNGSILQVNFTPTAYMLNIDSSVGTKMYLNDIMVHKLVEYSGDPGFEANEDNDSSEGFVYDDGTAPVAPGFTVDGAADVADGKTVDF